ncbi:MAG: DUF6785 family protein [Armatimonadota bacterium]
MDLHDLADDRARPARPISARAVIIGALWAIVFSIVNPYCQFYLRSWWIVGVGSLLAGPVMALFLMVCVNGLLAARRPRWALNRTELLVIYAMGLASLGFLGHGGLPYMVSYITYPFYMATPASGWDHTILPYLPTWLSPATREASYWFWEGLPEGAGVPWRAIAAPMFYWSLFTFLLLAAMYCLGALFSRDWVESQRLTFPLVDVPLAITGDGERPTPRTSLLANRIFWIGFAVPALAEALGFAHRYLPEVPTIPLGDVQIGKPYVGMALPWSVLGDTYFSMYLDVFGIMCLIPTEVSLSIWFFYVLYKVQLLVWAAFGVAEGASQSAIQPQSFVTFQETGAFIALAGVLLYESRFALRRMALNVVGRGERADGYEPLTGRGVVLGFALANLGLLWFGLRAGMSWWSLALLMGLFYALCIGSSRLVSAGGVMFISFDSPRSTVFRTIGGRPFDTSSLVLFEYINGIYMADPYNLAMPHMMNSFKLLRSDRISGRAFTWVALLATVLMLAVGVPAMLKMIYRDGATKLGDWPFSMWPRWGFQEVDSTLRLPERPDNWLRLAMGIGAVAMLGMSWLHLNASWWPVSPVGFLIASSWSTNHNLWGEALLGWLIVVSIKRWGGLPLYRKARPAFLGCVIGSYLSNALFGLLTSLDMWRRLSH